MGTPVAGFWASLKLVTDSKSFKKGEKHLNDVKSSVKGLISFAIKGISGLLAYSGVMSIFEGRSLRLANSLGISTTELNAWKQVASMAGIGADELASSMMNLEKKAQRVKLGEVDVGLAKSLGMLGVGFGEFNKAKSDVRMKMVISQAMKMEDKGKAAELVRDTLGDAGVELFKYMQLSGQSLDSMLAKGRALTFTNERTKKTAMIFNQELKSTIGGVKEIGNLFASSFAANFIPVLRGIQNLIIKNKQLIAVTVIKWGKELGKIMANLFVFVSRGIPFVVNLINKMGGLESVIKKIGIAFGIFMGAKLLGGLGDLSKGVGGIMNLFKGLISMAANPKLLLLSAMLISLYLIIEDIYYFMHGKGSVMGDFMKFFDIKGPTGEIFKAADIAEGKKEIKNRFQGLKDLFTGKKTEESENIRRLNAISVAKQQIWPFAIKSLNKRLEEQGTPYKTLSVEKRKNIMKEFESSLDKTLEGLNTEELNKIIEFRGKENELKITVETKGDKDVITGVEYNGEKFITGDTVKEATKKLQLSTRKK